MALERELRPIVMRVGLPASGGLRLEPATDGLDDALGRCWRSLDASAAVKSRAILDRTQQVLAELKALYTMLYELL